MRIQKIRKEKKENPLDAQIAFEAAEEICSG